VRAMIVVLWRAGLRIQEALALAEHDLDHRRGSLLVRNGKGGSRREIGMDEWGWEQLRPWLSARAERPLGPLFCIIDGPPAGARGRAPRSAPSSDGSPLSGAQASVRAAPTAPRARLPARASRSTSSSASSGTPTSARPRSTETRPQQRASSRLLRSSRVGAEPGARTQSRSLREAGATQCATGSDEFRPLDRSDRHELWIGVGERATRTSRGGAVKGDLCTSAWRRRRFVVLARGRSQAACPRP
jgi:hypothetical protein